ncbi:hypothetical protein V6N12_057572 [Hibiscus sabdariffa]|uniref:Uncharacterized protein n=1 Tax=Hibiscus sabdariffa TaxID=183260 RepID=A0ABR2C5J0_9ROSI
MPCCTATQSLLLSPSAYFAAAISALDNDSATTLDSTGIDGHDGGMKTAKRAKHFGKSMKGHSDGNGKKNFDKGSGTGTGTSRGQKRKMDQATTSQKSM